MNTKYTIIKGAFFLTLAGFATRIIGFFYRIFLSQTIGAEGMGIYQLIFPIYVLTFSLTASGIQTVISRNVAAATAYKKEGSALTILSTGTLLSLGLSVIAAAILYPMSDFLAVNFLQEPRCGQLLRFASLSIPFGAIHACVSGYYFGRKHTELPSLIQFLEQLVRVGTSYLVFLILSQQQLAPTPVIAIVGLVSSEIFAALFSITALLFSKTSVSKENVKIFSPAIGKNLMILSFPLTSNRVCVNLLQMLEAAYIPIMLRRFGMNQAEALSVYGVFTGMALPLVLFPSAITSSIATMLLPTIAEAQAVGGRQTIRHIIDKTIGYCVLLGSLCTVFFLLFGKKLGLLLFDSSMAGDFIIILSWISTFIYLSTTLSSILNGLGKTSLTFFSNITGLVIRILFVLFAIPHFGIQGYLWGVLASQLFTAGFCLWFCIKSKNADIIEKELK